MDSDSSSISDDSVDEIIAGKYKYQDEESSEEEEEALFNVDEDEEDDTDENDVLGNEFAIKLKKQEMESDLEDSGDEEEDMEKHLPDPKAWGSEKSAYYNTDYVDRGKRQQQYLKEDEEFAIAEEEEALAIQKRLIKEMKGSDLGMEWMANQSSDDEESETATAESIQADLSSLSDVEKLQFVKKMSPELIPLVNDMKKYAKEGLRLDPLIEFAMKDLRGTKLRKSSGFKLLKIKYDLMEKYLNNILVYLNLRTIESSEKIKKHPILGNLIKFKKLIEETDKIIESKKKLKSEVEYVLSQLEKGEEIEYDDANDDKEEKSSSDEDAVDLDASDEEDRRGITYEMSKNKGLTATKKKSVQNPRVKHRMKYKKALVKRKSQVREPRKEVSKYGGEFSGIKSSLVRSIKFKH